MTETSDFDTGAHRQQFQDWLQRFDTALRARDLDGVLALFGDECYWRDFVAFTWNLKTVEGPEGIRDMLAATLEQAAPQGWKLVSDPRPDAGAVGAWVTFETNAGRGKAHMRLRDGRCWTFFTALRELHGHEEKKGRRRWRGTDHHYGPGRKTWQQQRAEEQAELGHTRQPYCLVVGGGQGGIALAARLRRLGVPTIVVDRHARPGDAWRKRYKSLCLHDPVWYDHMPYLPFPDDWPVFTPKDKLGDWLEAYVRLMELNYWSSTTCTNARYDEAHGEWEVTVEREGRTVVLRPKQLVFAMGASGYPSVPKIPGQDSFSGQQHHSSAHSGGEAWRGKRCVVLGSNNSAHDICADLWENGAEVTMLQRSSTLIARSDTLMERVIGKLYSEEALEAGIDTDLADLMQASVPLRVAPRLNVPVYQQIAEIDAPFYDRLRAAGFLLDFGEDGSGLHTKYLRRGSGYYIDVGASELVAQGRIGLRSRVEIECIEPDGVRLTSGEKLPADLIVYATGYGSMNAWLADLVSPEVADRVGKCWGVGSDTTRDPGPWEGELRNMWKPTQQSGLWFHGGNLSQSRHYSLYLALQLKARMEGLAGPVWGMEPVHHRR
jgi:putative flavoprotein involved in K+ transport